MGEWIYRTDLHASWMSLMFFINIIFILVLFKIDAGRLKALLNLLKPVVYFGKYGNDKELNYFTFFNLFSFLIVSSALALGYFSFSSYTSSPMVYDFEFFYLLFFYRKKPNLKCGRGLRYLSKMHHILAQ